MLINHGSIKLVAQPEENTTLQNVYINETFNNLKMYGKEYKKTLDKSIKDYNNSISDKLKELHKGKPKEYWDILNSTNKKDKTSVNIDLMFEFMKKTNEGTVEDQEIDININLDNDTLLNQSITCEEIRNAVKKLKNNKAPCGDHVINEYIKTTMETFLPLYVNFFNLVFDSGLVTDDWLLGIIKPIYKGKGDRSQPENYRPITLLSCLGKLFTSIICDRLNTFADETHLINEAQTGFRKGYCTSDNIFVIDFLCKYALNNKRKLFCAFIDFKQAFDTVWRDGLWTKVLKSGIDGKCLRFIINMYKGIKSKVKIGQHLSDFFMCNIGVRQGENLSPFLFSLFINDLEDYLLRNQIEA